ncbi:MAG: ABC transporter ATP-binding protein [Clostridia bacterium]|nr:ABC transporter ATP-binding protein [Clostridia bacterium]
MIKIIKQFRFIDWMLVIFILSLIVTEVWIDLKIPDYTMLLTQSVASGQATNNDILTNGGWMLLYSLFSLICTIFCVLLCTRLASTISFRLREQVYDKVSQFSNCEMRKFSIASLVTRSTNDITQIQMFFAIGFQILIKAPIMAIWGICKISSTSIEWTLSTLICVFLIVVFITILVLICLPKFKKMQILIDNVNNATRENVSGIRVVHAFNAENYQQEKFEKVNTDLFKTQLFTIKGISLLMPVITLLMNGLTLAIYWIGAILINNAPVLERAMILGNMTAFTQYALLIIMSFILLVVVFIMLPRAMVAYKRVQEVLSCKVSIVEGSAPSPERVGTVEFRNVGLKSDSGNVEILSNISFTIKKGEHVAIIGATGSGKTSLIDLIPRFTEATSGAVLVDNMNVKDYKLDDLQTRVAVITQKAILFKGSIKDNIAYGEEEQSIDKERLKQAIDIAEAEFIYDLPDKLETESAQGGTNFSGGQKQRISIARAIYKNADIIIFDDSFSALDYKTDLTLRQNIRQHLPDKTIIIIAQRIGTIKNADKIIVLDNGKIVGMGSHNELLKTCPIYNQIALSQLSKEEL